MKRTSRVRVYFEKKQRGKNTNFVDVLVKTNGVGLTRDEAETQHDAAIDRVVEAVRHLPYVGTAPLRSVSIV